MARSGWPWTTESHVINQIHFGVLPPHEIIKMAKITVVRPDIYEADGTPVAGGLRDPHFGAIEPGEVCPVCGNTRDQCPGHFGKIDLARPVIVPHYGEALYTVLQSTCRSCGRLLIPPKRIEYLEKIYDRLRRKWPRLAQNFAVEVKKEAAQAGQCPHCGVEKYRIRFIKPFTFLEETPEGQVRLTPIDVRERVEKVPDRDLVLLGINPERARPEWMIITVLPVPPLSVRPSITLETGLRAEDDLTHALAELLRVNERLKELLTGNAPETLVEDAWMMLQHIVASYIDNELPNVWQLTHRRKRPLKTLAQRLKGKEGRLRGNLSGKRVNYSARTVISPDPFIGVNEVGVPIEIAKVLTVPMVVTPYNIEEARRYILNGPDTWPGATFVYKARTGKKIDLRYFRNYKQLAEGLEVGDIVERHLVNGDVVLFNRQPSLHRMSIMGHIVRVMPYKTFRLNPLVCPPYNADFDGDEMNLHVPRLYEAMAEARELMLVEKHILTPRYGGPIIGGRQDYISGAYLMTVKTSLFTEEEAREILAAAGYEGELPEPAIIAPKRLYTGKQLVSLFLPEDLDYEGIAKINAGPLKCDSPECFHDSYIVVRQGKLLEGVLDKNAIGAEKPNNLLHVIARVYGNDKARVLLDTLFKSFVRSVEIKGLTMAYSDIEIPREAKEEIARLIEEYKKKVEELIEQYKQGKLEPIPGRTLEESLEQKIISLLQELREKAGQVAVNSMDPFNDVFIMARTGARGSEVNITQMAAMLGQQTVRGKRIKRGFRRKTLPHFKDDDLSPEARGFVKGNFRDGLKPTEVFFHAAGGREGLVDTAVKTSQSGYMQRRLINALQDLVVTYEGLVRDSWGNVVQFKYGEDGVDPMLTFHGEPLNIDYIVARVKSRRSNGDKAAAAGGR